MSYLDEVKIFPPETIATLQAFIKEKRMAPDLETEVVNRILREDIFDLLSRECTVIYYPLPKEENDGFHVHMPVNGEKQHFVYINTAKRLEKQIYAAAHELGHIWTENGHAIGMTFDCAKDEDALMNRFAAELLMPEEVFGPAASRKLEEFKVEAGKIYVNDFFRVAAYLMDEYFVPFQAVVRRMAEVGIIEDAVCQHIITDVYKKTPEGEKLLLDCINEGGYTKLLAEPNEKKSMTGFPELLNQAEKNGIFQPQKVARLRDMLNLPKVDASGSTIEIR